VLAIVMFVSVTGALAALGDTLFPARSVSAGLHQDFLSTSSLYLRLRLTHPVFAVAGAIATLWIAGRVLIRLGPGRDRIATERVVVMTVVQMAAGAANVFLLAPVWMQILHLLIADALWVVTLLWALESLPRAEKLVDTQPDVSPAIAGHF
jgi:heme A synthase